ncbi:unnamed protein product [Phytomonas sp. Hart1]|nr:unnamed protein product [Phytomonas sp. Hart1]|eukprot:CCW66662.1 unnamed protein product [Phytomonas sp. isolate Hart1]
MAEVLAYLNEVVKSVSSWLMPTELDDIVRFLLGRHVQTVDLDAATTASGGLEKGTDGPTAANAQAEAEAEWLPSPPPLRQIALPDGLTAWHDFIPLGIATDSVVWGHSGDDGAALQTFFRGRGFDAVLSVNLTPTNGATLTGPSSALPHEDAQAEGPSASFRSIQESRFTCVEAIREWCKAVEEASKAGAPESPARGSTGPFPGLNAEAKRGRDALDRPSPAFPKGFTTRRLLVIVRCCTDNRATFSTTVSGKPSPRGRRKANGADNVGAARRHRYGSDQLQLFLHDFSSLGTFHNIRLRRRGWGIHLALLLLPEDQLYGGALLERRLEEDVRHLYHVKLFTQHDDYNVDENANQGESALGFNPHRPSATFARIHRLAMLWEPSLLRPPSSTEAAPRANSDGDAVAFRMEDLERRLLRERRFFFLRPHNLPLCCFLREALRRFPLLVPSAVLRGWQRVWAVRHSLQDVVLGFHTILMPFAFSSRWAAESSDRPSGAFGPGGDEGDPALSAVAPAASRDEIRKRRRTTRADLLADTTAILDGLLSASDAVGRGYRLDTAVIFMLLYAELLDGQGGSLHVLGCQPVVKALEEIYDREEEACGMSFGDAETVAPEGSSLVDTKHKARWALQHYLPFFRPAKGVPAVTVEQLPNLKISLANTLAKTLLDSVLPPDRSMQEILRVATYQVDSLATLHTPQSPEYCEGAWDERGVLSDNNFYHINIPDSVRVLYLLTAHAQRCEVEKAKYVRIVELQQVAQLSDEAVLLVLKELEMTGFIQINFQSQTACSLLQ